MSSTTTQTQNNSNNMERQPNTNLPFPSIQIGVLVGLLKIAAVSNTDDKKSDEKILFSVKKRVIRSMVIYPHPLNQHFRHLKRMSISTSRLLSPRLSVRMISRQRKLLDYLHLFSRLHYPRKRLAILLVALDEMSIISRVISMS